MIDYFKVQEAIEFATNNFNGVPSSSKPTLLHSIRCGLKLLDDGFDTDMIVAGVLHDVVEDTCVTVEEIKQKYGDNVAKIVGANSKNSSIEDENKRREELIERCCHESREALIVKLTDIYDNYLYYKAIDDNNLIGYCLELKGYVMKHIKEEHLKDDYIKPILDKII